jgi:hypothetical protein
MTELAEAIAKELRKHHGQENAITAPALAELLDQPEREIRRRISVEYREIQRFAGGLLCSLPGAGYFLTADAEEILHRYRLLKGLHAQAAAKLEDYQEAVREFGLGGILSKELAP